ncbi:MAG TPA: DUF1007 family protein [Bauldia sp.]|nr:DUF1007 family protein [Bauldia sp.]
MTAWFRIAPLAVLASLAGVADVSAHPHVFVDAKAELVFDRSGAITAVRNIWQFDQAFTEYAIQGLDANNDGKLSDDELKPLADINVKSLKEYAFFTYLTAGDTEARFEPPKEYWLEFHGGRLTLFFTLPIEKPFAVTRPATLEVFDPEYFVAFDFVKDRPLTLDAAPARCRAAFHPPAELDAQTMATLASIPVDQHDLPPDLVNAAASLANHFTVTC